MEWIGYVGLTALAVCWIPQTIDTLRNGRCDVNLGFLILSALGSAALALYAVMHHDTVFTLVNILTTSGAILNLTFKLFPRHRPE